MPSNKKYNLVAENPQSTVVAQYAPDGKRVAHYQSEAGLEKAFIEQLTTQAYEYLPITTEADLALNLRLQLEKLNGFTFSNKEWEHFFASEIANPNQSIIEKTATIQEDHIKNLTREDGTVKNVYLLKKDNIHENSLQVINQYATDEGQRANRYDVTVLVNGLPLVHIELKRRGVAIQDAFNQISRYQRESFWSESGLYEYIQLFIISNGTHTKYYSNTTRHQHIKESTEGSAKRGKRTSNSFEFTSWWADATNGQLRIDGFCKDFFCKAHFSTF
jgi:type I restriction enzyme R subunit